MGCVGLASGTPVVRDIAVQIRRAWWKRPSVIIGGVLIALLAGLLAAASITNWNPMRGLVGRQASRMAGRTIQIHGDLRVHLLSWTPSATADDLQVGSSNGTAGDLARIGRLGVQVRLLPLLTGRVELPLIDLERPDIHAVRDASGRANWRSAGARTPTKLPPIQHFVINNGHLHLMDQQRRLVIDAGIQSSETLGQGGQGSFLLSGLGSLNRTPFSLRLSGGPLIHVRINRPYLFDADLRAGGTHVLAKGVLPHPFDFGQVRTSLAVTGPDMADLYLLTGVAFPNTPPYSVNGELVRDGLRYDFSPIRGRVGHSDLQGRVQVDHSSGRPFVRADLRSRSLTLNDLGATVGAPPADAPKTALQQAEVARLAAQQRLLPNVTLDVSRIRSTDAVVQYQADSVIAARNLPFRRVKMKVTLDHGVLTADPLSFRFPSGELTGRVRVDARTDVPKDELDLKLSQVRLGDFFKTSPPPVDGIVQARAKLAGRGSSVHEVAATANGTIAIIVPHGQVRRTLGELLGINVTKALGLLLANDQSQMGVRCAVVDFGARDGVLTADQMIFDSDTVLTTGKGTVNLKDEALDLTLTGKPKHFRLVRLQAPITIGGHLKSPKLGLKPGAAPLQAAAAVALGALLSPLAAVLPFVDPGLAHNADCTGAEGAAKTTAAKPAPMPPSSAASHVK